MKRYVSFLALPAVLLLLWLLLNNTLAPTQILLGAALALVLGRAAMALRPLRSRLRKPWAIARLLCVVALDVARSNLAVARLIWSRTQQPTPGFIRIPLELRDPHGLAFLACIVTYTPGTVWTELASDGSLTLHVLDLDEESHWIDLIKQRYESPLMEIFE
ncbi:Na+/H+ antiporter subunit E [Candidimonas nitroreducens]|uniref:Na+/H+ antiporter subunit E n=1 Tax=Candidimonas nitroreducens TaxID=683354 RepID=A0A225M028_9BURK|nr:Na+/H+ antiporter subunit E [Candidimonas nitroreducens]OWT54745.1 Na+/H+ antiporter subunit E [Candidimonas nitroreducens]